MVSIISINVNKTDSKNLIKNIDKNEDLIKLNGEVKYSSYNSDVEYKYKDSIPEEIKKKSFTTKRIKKKHKGFVF